MSQHKHLYNTAAWRQLRVTQLTAEPLCRMCRALGRLVEARVVDHVQPHRGDVDLFFDDTNLQSLCKACHDRHKQAQEHSADGILRGAGHDGQPLDLSHPFYRPARPEIARSCSSALQTSAHTSEVAIAPNRLDSGRARGIPGQVGGVSKSTAMVPKTGCVPSFANCQNSMGGG